MEYPVLNKAPNVVDGVAVGYLDGSGNFVPVDSSHPLYVQLVEGVGSITWTKTVVTLDGSSDQLLAANSNRKGLIIANRLGNSQVDVDIAGGTVAANTGLPLLGGDVLKFDGPPTPLTKITAIGTNTQILNVWEGT